MKKILIIFSFVFIFFLVAQHTGSKESIVILYTANLNAVLRDCGCAGEKLGGFARIKTIVDSFRKKNNKVYLIDTGDSFSSYFYPVKNSFISELMTDLKYDFILKGDQEFISGKIIKNEATYYHQNKEMFNYLLPSKSINDIIPDSLKPKEKEFSFINTSPFLIFHGDSIAYDNYRAKYPEKKFIFLSHTQELYFKQDKEIVYMQAAYDTQFIGVAEFTKENETYTFIKNNFIKLDSLVPEDLEMKQKIDHFFTKQEYNGVDYSKQAKVVYLGAETCQKCHESEFNIWQKQAHAHAFETLKRENRAFDEACISCHVTGYKLGGYQNILFTPDLVNVQCESCHQNLPYDHFKAEKRLAYHPVDEKTCITCHTTKNSPEFNYLSYLNKIKHWK